MEQQSEAEIIAEETNIAVIKLSGRRYAGVLIQGDSLHNIFNATKEAIALIETDKNEAKEAMKFVFDELQWRIEAYKKATKE